MPKTKIFISSVNEDGLKPLRQKVYHQLKHLGHEPLMWEENLGPWPGHVDPVHRCLEAVEDSDIYLLFIGSRAGTYDANAMRTITHMEFIKACEQGKLILVFADTEVKQRYFGIIKPILEQCIEKYVTAESRFPSPTHLIELLQGDPRIPAGIDPYVWYLYYDMTQRKIYIDDLTLGVPIDWEMYFSDLLRRGSLLLPLEDYIEQTSLRLEQYDDAFELITSLLPSMQIAELEQPEELLEKIRRMLKGGDIEQVYGQYMTECIGCYRDCCAATLYTLQEDKLHLVAATGNAVPVPEFNLDDQSSYLSLTVQMGNPAEQIYYKEAKAMFYHCIFSGSKVLTLHYPADPDWNARKFIHYKESVNRAILSKNPLIIEWIKLFLGGLKR